MSSNHNYEEKLTIEALELLATKLESEAKELVKKKTWAEDSARDSEASVTLYIGSVKHARAEAKRYIAQADSISKQLEAIQADRKNIVRLLKQKKKD